MAAFILPIDSNSLPLFIYFEWVLDLKKKIKRLHSSHKDQYRLKKKIGSYIYLIAVAASCRQLFISMEITCTDLIMPYFPDSLISWLSIT